MGFFSRVRAQAEATNIIVHALHNWDRARSSDPTIEALPVIFSIWKDTMISQNMGTAALVGENAMLIYGCLPHEKGVEMLACRLCMELIPNFEETGDYRKWRLGMEDLVTLQEAGQYEAMVTLLRRYNPLSIRQLELSGFAVVGWLKVRHAFVRLYS